MTWIMSPQAHRRLLATMADVELRDLAREIARDLGLITRREEDVAETIYATLTRQH